MDSSFKTFGRIALAVAICLLVGALSGLATQTSVDTWYTTLNKPSFNPPNWVFGPVWTLLYLLMGVAAGLVWTRGTGQGPRNKALALFAFQLLLNASWSLVFFGLQMPLPALFILVALLALIALTIMAFRKVSPAAAYLMVPYLLWVAFAGILNFKIVELN
ncbi:TspO/MBR family protein [Robiginitalea marina]|uniref:Tryptophan-rich sensory protein n=1 Tax=Robiginitalea marina TaxID=2954105 RepID=A0ABT1AYC1_9FLAO|nr:TspO/MBR family protein [Robiginitalea marina]MCO5724617.1 tryptophan-rich sensory protein [Robiginitalea marina]